MGAWTMPSPRTTRWSSAPRRLIHEGKIRRLPPKDPRSAIYAAMLIGEYPDEIRTTKPPNGVLKALAVVGKTLRFKL
jgi:hypothetical protein